MQAVGDYISSKGRIAQKPIQLLSEAMWAYAVLGCHHRRMLDAIMQRVLYHIRNCPPTVLSQVSSSLYLVLIQSLPAISSSAAPSVSLQLTLFAVPASQQHESQT